MRKYLQSWGKLQIPDWGIPLGLLAVCLLSYGILISKLGFYQDDWHFIYYAYTRGAAGLTELLNYDGHPLAAPLYIASFNLLGFDPLKWQIYSLFWRWLAVAAFWLVMHRTWPAHRRATFTAAAIYAIYPLYSMQSMTIVYFEVWISHFLLAASFLLTIQALKQPRHFWLFTVLAILLKILHTFSSEYTWGLEFARAILIWLALPGVDNQPFRRRLTRTLQIFSPYLVIFLLTIAWRGFMYQSPVLARSTPGLADQVLATPIEGFRQLIFNSIPDMVLILITTWFRTISPDYFIFSRPVNIQILGLILVGFVGLAVFLTQLDDPQEEVERLDNRWLLQAFVFGATILIFGMLPSYAAGYFVTLKLEPWNGRFIIGSMPGVAVLLAIFIEKILTVPPTRILTAALVISLGIGWQVRMGNNFHWAWSDEVNFYRQMLLRAPDISPGTAIISNQEFLGLMGGYPTSFALNAIYARPGSASGSVSQNSQGYLNAKTWLFLVNSSFNGRPEGLLKNIPLEETKHSTHFSGNSSNSLVIYFEPGLGQCLWLITPGNASTPLVPKSLQVISPITNTLLIHPDAAPAPFLPGIVASQPDDWCSYYQRASLALQSGAWQTVVDQWQAAFNQDLQPNNGFEILPFIESYAHLGNWGQALALTKRADKASKGMEAVLCTTWQRIGQESAPSADRDKALLAFKELLDCK